MGLEFFKRVIELQQKHGRAGAVVANGLQTNGLLIDDAFARHLAQYNFLVGASRLGGLSEVRSTETAVARQVCGMRVSPLLCRRLSQKPTLQRCGSHATQCAMPWLAAVLSAHDRPIPATCEADSKGTESPDGMACSCVVGPGTAPEGGPKRSVSLWKRQEIQALL